MIKMQADKFVKEADYRTQVRLLLEALQDGPGVSSELAAELGIAMKVCGAALHSMWLRGLIDRSASRFPKTFGEGPKVRGFIYGLLGDVTHPASRVNTNHNRKLSTKVKIEKADSWQQKEISILREKYATCGPHKLQHLIPGRTRASIQHKAKRLGLEANKNLWRQIETNVQLMFELDMFLHADADAVRTIAALAKKYDVTTASIREHHQRYKYKASWKTTLMPSITTESDDTIIRKYYSSGGAVEVSKYLSGLSHWKIYKRAAQLGLKKDNRKKYTFYDEETVRQEKLKRLMDEA
jgi:hypothetical protein